MKEIWIDYFCGAGGASSGIRAAGRDVAVAINHDSKAIAAHLKNHPKTIHLIEDIKRLDPHEIAAMLEIHYAGRRTKGWGSVACNPSGHYFVGHAKQAMTDKGSVAHPTWLRIAGSYLVSKSIQHIHYRMLTIPEIAAAQTFPKGYKFSGNASNDKKFIGNAVPCILARKIVEVN